MRPPMIFSIALATSALLTGLTAYAASTAPSLIQPNGCSSCDAAGHKVVCPAWGWIAYRYQGKKDAVDSVANFIINGGVRYWKPWTGGIPMPSYPNLSKAQAKGIAPGVLSQPAVKPPAKP